MPSCLACAILPCLRHTQPVLARLPAAAHVLLHHVQLIKETPSTAVLATVSCPSFTVLRCCFLASPPRLLILPARLLPSLPPLALLLSSLSFDPSIRAAGPLRQLLPFLPILFPSMSSFTCAIKTRNYNRCCPRDCFVPPLPLS
jgi:hypothetical protein